MQRIDSGVASAAHAARGVVAPKRVACECLVPLDCANFNRVVRATVDHLLHWIAEAIEIVGALVIVAAAVLSMTRFLRDAARGAMDGAYARIRAELGRGILLGLEFLVAADILDTVAVTPSYESLGILALIVVIRTLLSFALQVEIDGQWPWRRAASERQAQATRQA